MIYPLRRRKRAQGPRLLLNFWLTAMVFAAAGLAVRPVALGGAAWASDQSFGLLYLLPLPCWARFAGGFLLLDLTFYFCHRLNHTYPLLWRFHNARWPSGKAALRPLEPGAPAPGFMLE